MRDLLKALNDTSPGDLAGLDDDELHRFEALCHQWCNQAADEKARRASLPRPKGRFDHPTDPNKRG
jgi:hypothetical protein